MGRPTTPMSSVQTKRRALLQCLLGGMSLALALTAVPGQAPVTASTPATASICPMEDHLQFHRCALEAARNFKPQALVAGRPDMSGLWRRRATAHEDLQAHPKTDDDHGGPSVIVDPADGIVPYQSWVLARLPDNVRHYMHHNPNMTEFQLHQSTSLRIQRILPLLSDSPLSDSARTRGPPPWPRQGLRRGRFEIPCSFAETGRSGCPRSRHLPGFPCQAENRAGKPWPS